MFFAVLGLHTLFIDLGMSFGDKHRWEKYLTVVVFGLLNSFYFSASPKQANAVAK